MLLIGLTGGIASGKTLVSDYFSELGIRIIDADLLAREVVKPGSEGLDALVKHFTTSILSVEGELNRAVLRQIVFSSPAERKFLDATLHPLIRQLGDKRICEAKGLKVPYVIYAIPLLVETNQQGRFDRVLVVDIPKKLQISRLQHRDGSSVGEADAILATQASREQRLHVANDIIDNSHGIEQTKKQVDELHSLYLSLGA